MTTHSRNDATDRLSVCVLVWGLRGGALANIGATLAQGLRTVGVDAELLVIHSPKDEEALRYADVPYQSLGSRRTATSALALARYLKRTRPDVLLAQSTVLNLLAIVAAGIARTGTAVVVTEQTDLSVATEKSSGANRTMRLIPPLVRWFYPRAQGLVSVSSRVFDDPIIAPLLARLPHAVIGNPITWDIAARTRDGVPHQWLKPVDGRTTTLVATGRLVEGKGFPLLIHAIARLRERGVSARLIILGEGYQRPLLERLRVETGLVDYVDLPGFTLNPYPTMAAADAFVLTSALEGSSMALLEAMNLGRPIVATAAGGTTEEVLRQGETGLVVPDGDVDALSNALELLITHPTLARTIGQAARQASADRRADRVADRYVEFLTMVLDRA